MSFDVRPRLVPVETRVVTCDDGGSLLVLRDPTGIAGDGLGLSPGAFWLASRLDGTRTRDDLLAQARAAGQAVAATELAVLIEALSEAGFVVGPAREAQRTRALGEWRGQAARPASCAGEVYPRDPAELRAALDSWLATGLDAGPAPSPPGPVRLLIAPHIDYTRGAAGYARAYRALAAADADLFVVLGTAHSTPAHLFTLTCLDHATPLGQVRVDRPAVEALLSALGENELLADELAHRDEHSVELQVVVLAHLVRRPFTILPVLCSSISHLADPAAATAPFLDALSAAVRGRRVCFVAGADLAHAGPAYGDPLPPSTRQLAALGAEDLRTLVHLESGDAAAFHRAAVKDDARRRLCGTAPIYAALRASGVPARLLHYEQWTDGTDMVSFAAAAG
jgi:MEMO1 family protein